MSQLILFLLHTCLSCVSLKPGIPIFLAAAETQSRSPLPPIMVDQGSLGPAPYVPVTRLERNVTFTKADRPKTVRPNLNLLNKRTAIDSEADFRPSTV